MNDYNELFHREFLSRHAKLNGLAGSIRQAAISIAKVCKPNKIMSCGCGGSASDSLHITGELMKSFRIKRPAGRDSECAAFPALEGAIPAVSLVAEVSFNSAVMNDVDAGLVFAQSVYGLGVQGDILIAFSTSGNSQPVVNAARVALELGVQVIAFTGKEGGKLKDLSDILLNVPETETYLVQELHLSLYHYLCQAAEYMRWGS